VRRIERVRLHADLTILSQLTSALNQERVLAALGGIEVAGKITS
jgi:hypothetical protein